MASDSISAPVLASTHLIQGNCVDILSGMKDKSIDLILGDPPYGIGVEYGSYVDTEANWYELMEQFLPEAIRVAKMVIVPSCKIARLGWFYRNFPPDWLICWYKGSPGHASFIGFNDWEPHVVYGKTKSRLYMHDYFQTRGSPKRGTHNHPCPKPEEWSDWLVSRATSPGMSVLDPFLGSGTTGVSCRRLQRHFIGIDLEGSYLQYAKHRILSTTVAEQTVYPSSDHSANSIRQPL